MDGTILRNSSYLRRVFGDNPSTSMGTTAARHGYQIIENARRVLAIECVIALQAAELKGVEGFFMKLTVMCNGWHDTSKLIILATCFW
jgi:histidine ammonia-lyase